MGLTFKENCPDIRNTRSIDIADEFKKYHANVLFYDPWTNHKESFEEYGIELVKNPQRQEYDAVILAVAHDELKAKGIEKITAFCKENHEIFDVKNIFNRKDVDGRL